MVGTDSRNWTPKKNIYIQTDINMDSIDSYLYFKPLVVALGPILDSGGNLPWCTRGFARSDTKWQNPTTFGRNSILHMKETRIRNERSNGARGGYSGHFGYLVNNYGLKLVERKKKPFCIVISWS